MKPYIWVAAGGATGTILRAIISQLFPLQNGFHIVAINIVGSFLLALIYTSFSSVTRLGQQMRWLLGVGLMGGFTTMSTFSVDIVRLLNSQQIVAAVLYIALSLLGGLTASWAGIKLMSRQKGER